MAIAQTKPAGLACAGDDGLLGELSATGHPLPATVEALLAAPGALDHERIVTFGPSRDELYRHEHVFRVIDRPRRILLDTTVSRADGSIVEYETEFIFEARDGKTLSSVGSRPPSFARSIGPVCRAHSRASSG